MPFNLSQMWWQLKGYASRERSNATISSIPRENMNLNGDMLLGLETCSIPRMFYINSRLCITSGYAIFVLI